MILIKVGKIVLNNGPLSFFSTTSSKDAEDIDNWISIVFLIFLLIIGIIVVWVYTIVKLLLFTPLTLTASDPVLDFIKVFNSLYSTETIIL